METTLGLLGGGSSGGNESNSTVAKSEVANKEYPPEAELELGLGLSLGGGGGGRVKPCKPCAWGEYRRILTAKDFPSVVSQDDSSAISGFNRANGSAGTKRSADTAAQEVSSATAVSQVVGWPPIRAYRMNSLVNQAKAPTSEQDKIVNESDKTRDALKGKSYSGEQNKNDADFREKAPLGFVKVNMDGLPIGRKVDLNAHTCYETLAQILEDMFFRPSKAIGFTSSGGEKEKGSKLLDGSSEFVLTYEDREGDWMLVGDVPWGMFRSTVKRLRIMRTSEANGLAPRSEERNQRQRS